jgi:hypothetical protein
MALTATDIGARTHYAASTETKSITLTSGVDLLVVRHVNCDNGDVVSAMTYNGVALTKKGSETNGASAGYATLWYLVAPANGSAHNLVITLDGSSHHCDFDWISFTGSNQSTPLGTLGQTNTIGSSTSVSLTVTDGATGDIVIDVGMLFQSTAPSPSVTHGQTVDSNGANSTSSTDPYIVSSHIAGGSSVPVGWSWSGGHSTAYLAVNVKAAIARGDRQPGFRFGFR